MRASLPVVVHGHALDFRELGGERHRHKTGPFTPTRTAGRTSTVTRTPTD